MKVNIDTSEVLELFRAFNEEQEGKPQLKTWLGVLLWSLQNTSIDDFADEKINSLREITVHTNTKKIKLTVDKAVDYTSDLNDNCFVVASDIVADFAKKVSKESNKKMTAEIFFDSITEALHQIKDPLFEDVDQHDIEKILPGYSSSKTQKIKKGDVVSVPLPKDSFALMVAIGDTSFGTGYGVIDKRFNNFSPNQLKDEEVLKYPLFGSNKLPEKGKWKMVFHDESLLNLFPGTLEKFHSPLLFEEAKPFGLAETSDGTLRKLSKEEADKIGVAEKDFKQVMLPEEIERYLDRKLHN
ncbi:MAG: hypothetical protein JNK79_00410 [Chitinophagaceae bacterium]|nr:hypothetical protein [Chitinophagaceae bacterium]